MKRLLSFLMAVAILLSFCGCDEDIPDIPVISDVTSDQNVPDNVVSGVPSQNDDPKNNEEVVLNTSGTLYGSYLTMCSNEDIEYPYIKVFNSFAEVSDYFDSNCEQFFFGHKFTMACGSFNDEFLKDNDVMMLVLSEDSTYISHLAKSVTITTSGVKFELIRKIPQDAPKTSTQYHLVFTAPNGSFDGMEDLPFELDITEVIDKADDTTFDAERFKMIYPEFWPYVYRCDATGEAQTIVDTITSYSELISFYEQYSDTYDLEAEFKRHIGALYDQYSFFDEYVLLAIMVPSQNISGGIAIDELFVYNLDIYVSIKNTSPAVVSDTTECYLVTAAVTKSDLMGVNLEWFNISFD